MLAQGQKRVCTWIMNLNAHDPSRTRYPNVVTDRNAWTHMQPVQTADALVRSGIQLVTRGEEDETLPTPTVQRTEQNWHEGNI